MKGGAFVVALYIFLILLAIIILLLLLRAELHIVYENELSVYVRVLWFKYFIYPEQSEGFNEKKYDKKQKKKKKSGLTTLKSSESIKNKPSLIDKLNIIKEVLSVVFKAFKKHLHVKVAKLNVTVATDDAAKTAILYGAVSGIVASIVELLDSFTKLSPLKNRSVSVESDFVSDKSRADINITLSISVFGALATLSKVFWRYTVLKNSK